MTELKTPEITRLIYITPDELIEVGQRMKQMAMDFSKPGETVLVNIGDRLTVAWSPDQIFTKPTHVYSQNQVEVPLSVS